MALYTGVVLVAVLVASGGVGGQRLTFSPDTIVDGTTSSLTVRCDVSSSDIVYYIRLYKGTTPLASGDSRGMRVESGFQQRVTAAGSLDPPATAYLAVTFNAAVSCSDAGDYRCQYSAGDLTVPSASVNRSLPATSNPGNINMIVTPRLVVTAYNVNDSVELVCAGEVGFPVVGTWRWETRDVSFASSWTPIRPSIQQTDDPNTGTGCQRRGRSTLRFQVQLEDDNRMYRCSFRSEQYSANFTFQVRALSPAPTSPSAETTSRAVSSETLQSTAAPDMTSPSVPTSCPCAADTQGQATTQGLSTGSAVALAVVLTFLLTLGGTLAVVFLVLHRRHQPGAAGGQAAGQEGDYSGLDLASREPPRSDVIYHQLDHDQNLPSVPGNRPSRP